MMAYVKVTVESALRSISMLVPTRDRNDCPLAEGEVLGNLRVVVTDLFYLALGYPERDYLEQADPWHSVAASPWVSSCRYCGHSRPAHSHADGSCAVGACSCSYFREVTA